MKGSILLIEDNGNSRYLVTSLLEAQGHEVTQALDGDVGVQVATLLLPDLILLGIQPPTMEGYAVARELRRHPALRDTPIVAVTSHARPGDRKKCLAAGCDGSIEKPIDPRTFIAVVERYLSAARRGLQ